MVVDCDVTVDDGENKGVHDDEVDKGVDEGGGGGGGDNLLLRRVLILDVSEDEELNELSVEVNVEVVEDKAAFKALELHVNPTEVRVMVDSEAVFVAAVKVADKIDDTVDIGVVDDFVLIVVRVGVCGNEFALGTNDVEGNTVGVVLPTPFDLPALGVVFLLFRFVE